jgi:orotate phosphoribosyltransferase
MDSEIFEALRISGNVLCFGKKIVQPGCKMFYKDSRSRFDWVYCHGAQSLHQCINVEPLVALCERAKHVAVVYHTRQSGLLEGGRMHHKKKHLDAAFGKNLVSSQMIGNYYAAIISQESEWRFITVEELASATLDLISKLPSDVGAVVAMHRSGSVPAAMIATTLHIPCHVYSDANGLVEMVGGGRTKAMKEDSQLRLVLDDTVSTGRSMLRVKNWIAKNDNVNRYAYAAIFATPHGAKEVDVFSKTLRTPHLLEWNLLNSGIIRSMAVDLDGVLCYDPPHFDETTEDGRAAYLSWIRNAKVRHPARWSPLSAIVSYRCEYTREATEEWLRKSGILYDSLHLFPGNPQDRTFKASQWKGRFYKKSPHGLFVESSALQAKGIREYSGKPVLDLENKQMLGVLT